MEELVKIVFEEALVLALKEKFHLKKKKSVRGYIRGMRQNFVPLVAHKFQCFVS